MRPRLLIIGAGSRGNAYARAVTQSTDARITAVADPIDFKRTSLGRKYIWGINGEPSEAQSFHNHKSFIQYEQRRRVEEAAGRPVEPGIDGVFICTLDHTHADIIVALQPLRLHIMGEKPLATSLNDCLRIRQSLIPDGSEQERIFSVGHVLHYSPHNMLLRRLLVEDEIIGEIVSMEHTEPVGWWHFAHSYVRGNWRKESTSAPSLMTKSCHDIDLILWLLCSESRSCRETPHLPRYISSSGSLSYYRKARKPAAARGFTNCLSCDYEPECTYSAKKIYLDHHLSNGNTGWPVKIVNPDIEDINKQHGHLAAKERLLEALGEDYDERSPLEQVSSRPWFGRCVWDSDNDVCDNQVVTMTWDDDPLPAKAGRHESDCLRGRGAKTATFNMIAYTEQQCERRGRIYGSKGEIAYDSKEIRIYDFATKKTETYSPAQPGGGHGGGDDGLARQFVEAIIAVHRGKMSAAEAQTAHIGCTLNDVILSHQIVFAAEEARRDHKVVDCLQWLQSHT